MKKLLVAILLSISACAFAGNRGEIFFSASVYPGRLAFGYNYYENSYDILGVSGLEGKYLTSEYYSRELTTNTWTLGYTYNFTKVIALQATLSYEGGWCTFYRWDTGGEVWNSSDNYITAAGHFKVNWLNRKIVRLYSSAGLGVSVEIIKKPQPGSLWNPPETNVKPAFQICPFGISVGRRVYGFAEIGLGTIYAGGCIGVGYRF